MLSPIILSASNFSPTNNELINNNLGNYDNIRNLQGAGTISSSPSSIITPIGTISASATRAVGTLSATNTRRAAGTQSATVTATRTRAGGLPSATVTATRTRAGGLPSATVTATRTRVAGTQSATVTATRTRVAGTQSATVTATRTRAVGTPSGTVTATRTRAVGTPSGTVTATRTRAVGTPSATVTRTVTATATGSRAGGSPSATNTGTVTSTDTKTGTPNVTPSITSSQIVGTVTNTVTSTATSSTQLGPFQILIQGKQVLGYYNMILTSLQSFAGGSSIIQITSINWLNDVFAVTGSSNQAQLIKTQYESSIQYQQLELQLNPTTAEQSPAASATQQSIALPVGIGVGGLIAVALIVFGIVYVKQNNKKRRLISGSNEQEKKNTIQPQHIAINYNDTYDSQTAQKVVNPFQRRNSVGVLEYEPVTVEQRPQSIRNMDLKQAFPPVKTNIFKPLDNTRTKILTKSISVYPPPQELPPPPFNPDTEDERLPE